MHNLLQRILEKAFQIDEMAYNKSRAIDILSYSSYSINEHIAKLILWGWNSDWAKTLYDISVIANKIKLKPNSSKPNKSFIEEYLFRSHFTYTKDFVEFCNDYKNNYTIEYGQYRDNIASANRKQMYEAILKFVVNEIYEKTSIDRTNFYNKIKAIIHK